MVFPSQFGRLLVEYQEHPESKSLAPDGTPCKSDTKGLLKRAHIVAGDYAKTLYDRQDADLKALYPLDAPLAKQSGLELNFRHGNRIVGIPHGADKIRSYHPTALFIDEAAFVPDAGQSYDEAIAACQKIAVLSSANTGWFESVVVSAE